MAGGVANIWGNLLPTPDEGGSRSYAHGDVQIRHRIKTCATFFRDKHRFRKDFVRDNRLADPRQGTTEVPDPPPISVCLRSPRNAQFVFYKEDCAGVGMDLREMSGTQPAIAVDARQEYHEIDLGTRSPGKHAWNAPHKSDWAIAGGLLQLLVAAPQHSHLVVEPAGDVWQRSAKVRTNELQVRMLIKDA